MRRIALLNEKYNRFYPEASLHTCFIIRLLIAQEFITSTLVLSITHIKNISFFYQYYLSSFQIEIIMISYVHYREKMLVKSPKRIMNFSSKIIILWLRIFYLFVYIKSVYNWIVYFSNLNCVLFGILWIIYYNLFFIEFWWNYYNSTLMQPSKQLLVMI